MARRKNLILGGAIIGVFPISLFLVLRFVPGAEEFLDAHSMASGAAIIVWLVAACWALDEFWGISLEVAAVFVALWLLVSALCLGLAALTPGVGAYLDSHDWPVAITLLPGLVAAILARNAIPRWLAKWDLELVSTVFTLLWFGLLAAAFRSAMECEFVTERLPVRVLYASPIPGTRVAVSLALSALVCFISARLWGFFKAWRRLKPHQVERRFSEASTEEIINAYHNPALLPATSAALLKLLESRNLTAAEVEDLRSDVNEHCLPSFSPPPTPELALRRMRRWKALSRFLGAVALLSIATAFALFPAHKAYMERRGEEILKQRTNLKSEDFEKLSTEDLSELKEQLAAQTDGYFPNARGNFLMISFLFGLGVYCIIAPVCWPYPVRILLLRPFQTKNVSTGLRRLARRNLIHHGHIFTLADRYMRESSLLQLAKILPTSPSQALGLILYPIMRRANPRIVVRNENDYKALRSRLWSRWILNSIWMNSFFNKVRKVRTSDAWWKRSIDLLAGTCEVIIVDLSLVKQGTHWELAKIFREDLQKKCVFVAKGDQLDTASVELEKYHHDEREVRIFAYDESGRVTEPEAFQQRVANCISQPRPKFHGKPALSGLALNCVFVTTTPLIAATLAFWGAGHGGDDNPAYNIGLPLAIASSFYGMVLGIPLLLGALRKIRYSDGRQYGTALVSFLLGIWSLAAALPLLAVATNPVLLSLLNSRDANGPTSETIEQGQQTALSGPAMPQSLDELLEAYEKRRGTASEVLDAIPAEQRGSAMAVLKTLAGTAPARQPPLTGEMLAQVCDKLEPSERKKLPADVLLRVCNDEVDTAFTLHRADLQSATPDPRSQEVIQAICNRILRLASDVTIDPDDEDTQRTLDKLLASTYEVSGNPSKAVELTQQQIAAERLRFKGTLNSDQANIILAPMEVNLGWYLLKTQSYAESEKVTREVLALGYNEGFSAQINLAHALMLQGKEVESWAIHQQHLSTSPDNGGAPGAWIETAHLDFADLRRSGIQSPLMDKFDQLLEEAAANTLQ